MAPRNEYEGKNLDAAIEEACRAMNVEKEKLRYEVMSYGSTGIFGIVGAKKARIRVKNAAPGTAGQKQRRSEPPESEKPELIPEPEPEPDLKPEPAEAEAPAASRPASDAGKEAGGASPTLAELEAAAQKGEQCLRRIVDAISEETTITAELASESVRFEVHGGNAGVLIGKRGQTLEAIQYLVDKMVNQPGEGRVRIVVDVEGYWENRRSSLKEMAVRMAGKSKKTGKPITLGQMNAHDRRIVHLALKDDPNIRTQSRGEGFFRKLVIFPRKAPPSQRQRAKE